METLKGILGTVLVTLIVVLVGINMYAIGKGDIQIGVYRYLNDHVIETGTMRVDNAISERNIIKDQGWHISGLVVNR